MTPLFRRLLVTLVALIPPAALAQCPQLSLNPGTTQSVPCDPTPFTVAPVAGHWNAVAVGTTSSLPATNWNLTLFPAISSVPTSVDFAISNGHLGAPAFTLGVVDRVTGFAPGLLGHFAAGALSVNVPANVTLPGGVPMRLYEFEVTTFGNYAITVNSGTSLAWELFAPGANAEWRARNAFLQAGVAGSTIVVALFPGWHALAVSRTTVVGPSDVTMTLSVTCGATPIAPAVNATIPISQPCQYFTVQPSASQWNLVGITSTSNWDLTVAGVTSSLPGAAADAVVANGHLGTIPGGSATFNRQSGTAGAWAVHAVNATPLTFGTTVAGSWTSFTVAKLYEFHVTSPGTYNIAVSGQGSLKWEVQLPGASSAWRPRNASSFGGTFAGGGTSSPLFPGWHALLVTVDGGVGSPGPFTVTVNQVPSPIPSVTGILPQNVLAGSGAYTMNVFGTGFVASSQVRWSGQPLPTTMVSPVHLQAQVAGSTIAKPELAEVDVVTPAPGGGTSGTTYAYVSAPRLFTMNPSSIPAPVPPWSPAIGLVLTGEFFEPSATVYANGVLLSSTFVSSTEINCTLPSTIPQMQHEGGIALQVVNYGAVVSSVRSFRIGTAGNQGSVVTDPPQPLAGTPFSIRVQGGGMGDPVTILASLPPASPTVLAGTPFLLGVDLGSVIPIVDGIGLFGPAAPAAFGYFTPAHSKEGLFVLPGLMMPYPVVGIDIALQAIYLDQFSPFGFSLTWTRAPFSL